MPSAYLPFFRQIMDRTPEEAEIAADDNSTQSTGTKIPSGEIEDYTYNGHAITHEEVVSLVDAMRAYLTSHRIHSPRLIHILQSSTTCLRITKCAN